MKCAVGIVLALLPAACSHGNNLLLGRVQSIVDGHVVIITDCYRTNVEPPHQLADGAWEFMPCHDAKVIIRGTTLTVNGRSCGPLRPSDSVLVDHGIVSVTH